MPRVRTGSEPRCEAEGCGRLAFLSVIEERGGEPYLADYCNVHYGPARRAPKEVIKRAGRRERERAGFTTMNPLTWGTNRKRTDRFTASTLQELVDERTIKGWGRPNRSTWTVTGVDRSVASHPEVTLTYTRRQIRIFLEGAHAGTGILHRLTDRPPSPAVSFIKTGGSVVGYTILSIVVFGGLAITIYVSIRAIANGGGQAGGAAVYLGLLAVGLAFAIFEYIRDRD